MAGLSKIAPLSGKLFTMKMFKDTQGRDLLSPFYYLLAYFYTYFSYTSTACITSHNIDINEIFVQIQKYISIAGTIENLEDIENIKCHKYPIAIEIWQIDFKN